jgi:hypothetical protein
MTRVVPKPPLLNKEYTQSIWPDEQNQIDVVFTLVPSVRLPETPRPRHDALDSSVQVGRWT